jgi:hypothetical protein
MHPSGAANTLCGRLGFPEQISPSKAIGLAPGVSNGLTGPSKGILGLYLRLLTDGVVPPPSTQNPIPWSEAPGYCWIPYDYLTNPHLASDFWAIRALVVK